MAGQPEETAEELLAAASASRAEVRGRPSIRRIGGELARRTTAAGHTVTGTFKNTSGSLAQIQWLPLDLRNRDEIAMELDKVQPQAVINAARSEGRLGDDSRGRHPGRDGRRQPRSPTRARVERRGLLRCTGHLRRKRNTRSGYPYGAAKAAAQTAIRLVNPAALIVRTSLIIGDGNSGHVSDLAAAMLELTPSEHSGIGPKTRIEHIGESWSARLASSECPTSCRPITTDSA